MTNKKPLRSARQAILSTLPEETSLFGRAPEPKFVHIPASHAKALHPDVQVVKGMRGSGKSFWWAGLQDRKIQTLVAQRVSSLGLFQRVSVSVGFGEKSDPSHYPGKDTLADLLRKKHDPRLIWQTVVLNALAPNFFSGKEDWTDRLTEVQQNPQKVERTLFDLDRRLEQENRYAIVLFDALDRSASDWDTMNRLIRGLLQVALDLRPYRRLRLKCFLRTDQLDERKVADFPDASKVFSSSLELSWPVAELYGMLFQYLGNGDTADFREDMAMHHRLEWRQAGQVSLLPDGLARDEKMQREVFHAITGPWMGRDRRRGFPYSWVPGHLADAAGRTSPRSFLAALRKAAEDSEDRYKDHEWPLHYESIKRGVQAASEIRRKELREDYPWVDALIEALKGKVVPCVFADIASTWSNSGVMRTLEAEGERLPPAHLEEGPAGLRKDLEELAIFLRMKDDRVNIPDVFRVAYGLGRRGGVKPIRRNEG
ncbi:MAG TPA: hypothetical protein P5234_15100 [Thermoanaerobaculaceae bacterium]|nr:hypothetical protein [Thermoanaerobaculaceae bacterium]